MNFKLVEGPSKIDPGARSGFQPGSHLFLGRRAPSFFVMCSHVATVSSHIQSMNILQHEHSNMSANPLRLYRTLNCKTHKYTITQFLTAQIIIYIFAGICYNGGSFSCILLLKSLSLNSISLNNSFKSSNNYVPSHTTMNWMISSSLFNAHFF